MERADSDAIERACGTLVSGLFVASAGHDGRRAGVLVRGAHVCSDSPPLLVVSVRKGHPIEPVIRDSRAFALSSVDPGDRVLVRRFGAPPPADRHFDPFDATPTRTLVSRSPVLASSALAFDCQVERHVDLECDHELYVGRVVAALANGVAPSPLPLRELPRWPTETP